MRNIDFAPKGEGKRCREEIQKKIPEARSACWIRVTAGVEPVKGELLVGLPRFYPLGLSHTLKASVDSGEPRVRRERSTTGRGWTSEKKGIRTERPGASGGSVLDGYRLSIWIGGFYCDLFVGVDT